MKPWTTCSALLIFLAASAAGASRDFDAAARAKAIAPLVEEGTMLVVHVDLSRISPQPMLDFLGLVRFIRPLDTWGGQDGGLSQAGVRDLYLIAPSAIFALEQPRMLMAIPISSVEQERALRTNLRLRREETRSVGRFLLIGNRLLAPKTFRAADRPELTAAFEAAGDTAVQVLLIPPADTQRVVDELWPQLPPQLGGGPSSVLTRGIRWVAAGIDVSPHKTIRLVIKSDDAPAAEALRGKLAGLLGLAGQWPELQQHVPNFKAVAALLTPKVEKDRLTVSSGENVESFEKTLAAIMQPMLEAEAHAATANNLKEVGLAMLRYYYANKHFPLPASRSPDGKPLLSWRVHVLPYLECEALYRQFHLDEPWDSPHNRTLIDKMPPVYRLSISKTEKGRTNYLLPVGNGAVFDADKPTELKDIRDGTSNTIMVVTVDDAHAAIWTKPDDWPFDPKDPREGLGRFFQGGFTATFCDGSVHSLVWPENPKGMTRLRALFTRAGGETMDW